MVCTPELDPEAGSDIAATDTVNKAAATAPIVKTDNFFKAFSP
jgi:hypothetical protein